MRTAAVVRRPGRAEVKVYAFGGRGAPTTEAAARRAYRRRFGIGTSYRRMNECRGKTTRKDVARRLPPVGPALLLRQVWVWLTWQLAHGRGARTTRWLGELPLRRMPDWLADELRKRYKEGRWIDFRPPRFAPYPAAAA